MNQPMTQQNVGMGGTGQTYTPDEFAQQIKNQYPQYQNVDNYTLTQKMVEKYPVYASKINMSQPQPQMPLLTVPNQADQCGFCNSLKDVAIGAGKDLIGTARDTAGLLQSAGKFVANKVGITPLPTGEANPQLGFQSVDNSTPEGAGVADTLASKSRGEQVGKVLSFVGQLGTGLASKEGQTAITKAKQGYDAYQVGKEAKATANASGKVTEMISPKATAKEAKLAQAQGRFVEGKPATTFRSSTPDTITPSKKTLSASETVVKNIPNAQKMSPGELYKAVDNNITETAQKLRPQMEATPIKPETIQKINDDWSALKKTQMADAPATEEANVAKRQAKFESLLQKSGNQSHADLWDTAINYDNSISDGVKKANSLSPESLQLQKQEWLDNRQILSDAIDKTGKPEFKQMSNMYEAKNGLISQTKLDTKIQPSKISQAYNSKVGKVVRGIVKLGVGGKILGSELGH